MPSKKKKYNARFPAGRIKKIMQSDEEVGKVAQAVPIIISRTLELFVESLLNKTLRITNARNAKTLSPSHMKQCIMSESRFDFLRELVKNVPDINVDEASAEDNQIATDLTMPYKSTTSSRSESPVGGCSKLSKSTPPFNGNVSPATTSPIRNGNKRSSTVGPTIPTATATSSKSKPQPLLKTQSMDQSLYTNMSTSSYKSPNFYTEISSNSVIQYTPKIQTNSHLDVRPPKLTRIDSAPAGLSNIHNAIYDQLTKCDTPPVMTFDFTKTSLPPPLYPSINIKPQIPPLKPIVHPTTSLHSPYSYLPSTSTLTPPPPTITTAPPYSPYVKIDVSNSSVRADSNNLNSTSSPSTSKPMTPILNIDLSNSFNITQSLFHSIDSSNNLDMDEDYDNI